MHTAMLPSSRRRRGAGLLSRLAVAGVLRRLAVAGVLLIPRSAAAQDSAAQDTATDQGVETAPSTDEKRLTWPSVRVRARLDAEGRLHVVERQVMRFVGDWNGGERSFSPRFGQSLTLVSMTRLDEATGAAQPMVEGPLDRVDEYKWTSSNTLRWRSRLPEDPPFRGERRTYELEVVYDNVLQPRENGWLLDHDFGFANRAEAIDSFTVSLELDPVWRAPEGTPATWAQAPLAAGDGYVVTVPLTRLDGREPSAVFRGAPPEVRWGLILAIWSGLAWFVVPLVRRERDSTRWQPMPLPPVTPDWLKAQVFSLAPEVAGAAWDNTTAAPEVAAVLARLVTEGKLTSTVREEKVLFIRRQVLELGLPKGRGVFRGDEKALIEALFESGATTTDTDLVRERYRKSGFDPSRLISNGIATTLAKLAPDLPGATTRDWKTPVLMSLGAIALFTIGIMRRGSDGAVLALSSVPIVFTLMLGTGVAAVYQRELFHLRGMAMLLALVLVLPAAAMTWFLALPPTPFGGFTLAGAVLAWLVLARSTLRLAAPELSPKRVALRRRLAHAREFFRAELAKPAPALEDTWFPWLIAFGLGSAVDKWFRAFGGAAATSGIGRMASSSGSTGGSSSGGGWTGFGGGGGFAGGGSSASFAAAVGGMAASVPKPGSSSGGGGGGGGSSGGGGGGGW